MSDFDVIVVGGGPAGENVAGKCSEGGLRTVLVERELVGGECSYWAWMRPKPSCGRARPCTPRARRRRPPRSTSTPRSPTATSWSPTTPTQAKQYVLVEQMPAGGYVRARGQEHGEGVVGEQLHNEGAADGGDGQADAHCHQDGPVTEPRLARRLCTGDAVVVGLSAMIGGVCSWCSRRRPRPPALGC